MSSHREPSLHLHFNSVVESLVKKLKRKRIHKCWVPVVAIMADLVLGAVLGTAFTVLYAAVDKATVGKFNQFKPLLGALQSTLDSIQPLVIKQIEEYNVKLELPNDEIEELVKQMKEGEKLVRKLSKLRFWNRIKSRYTDQLVELDGSLKGLLKHIVMQQARDIKENLLVAKQTATQLVQFQEFNERLFKRTEVAARRRKGFAGQVCFGTAKQRETTASIARSDRRIGETARGEGTDY